MGQQVRVRVVDGQQQHSSSPEMDSEGYTPVVNRRNRNRAVLQGSNVLPSSLRGVPVPPKRSELFVGRLDGDTVADGVLAHAIGVLGSAEGVSVEEIASCYEKWGYRGFKLTVPPEEVSKLMCAEAWPCHVTVKKFFSRDRDSSRYS